MALLTPTLAVIAVLILFSLQGWRLRTIDPADCDRKFLEFARRHGLEHNAARGIKGNLGAHYLQIDKRPAPPPTPPPKDRRGSARSATTPIDISSRYAPFDNHFTLRFGQPVDF